MDYIITLGPAWARLYNNLFQRRKRFKTLGMVTHAFSPNTQEGEAGGSEFETSFVYKLSYKIARAVTETPCHILKKKKKFKKLSFLFTNISKNISNYNSMKQVHERNEGRGESVGLIGRQCP